MKPLLAWATLAATIGNGAHAIEVDFSSPKSIKSAASTIADGMASFYKGNEEGNTPGILPDPYHWFQGGLMFGDLVDYWYYTGDDTYNDIVQQALIHQQGRGDNYQPVNQTRTMGNDDQGCWALAAMAAAEYSFPHPDGKENWVEVARNVFDTLAARWDSETCGGGLRWQLFPFQPGHRLKNSLSTGTFFELSARLARYTQNETYVEWAGKAWDWVADVGLLSPKLGILDSAEVSDNCSDISPFQWTGNNAVFLAGAASMYSATDGGSVWKERISGLLESIDVFFKNDIMQEIACEPNDLCDVGQRVFKSRLSRALGITTILAPFTGDIIEPKVSASAAAAAKQCSGGDTGTRCGFKWTQKGKYDGSSGLSEQMSALQIILANLAGNEGPPGTSDSPPTPDGTGPSGTPTSSGGPESSNSDSPARLTFGKPQYETIGSLLAFAALAGHVM